MSECEHKWVYVGGADAARRAVELDVVIERCATCNAGRARKALGGEVRPWSSGYAAEKPHQTRPPVK